MFIVFEGIDGTGKSTQCQMLLEYFQVLKRKVVLTREPGGTAHGEQIRELLLKSKTDIWLPSSEVLLMVTARIEHWFKFIKPHLDDGYIVICDRFILSTLAYQGYGHSVPLENIYKLHELFLPGVWPNLNIILDKPYDEKKCTNQNDRFEQFDCDFKKRVVEGYRELSKTKDSILIDATGSIDAVHSAVINI